jgi:hypothetical protein
MAERSLSGDSSVNWMLTVYPSGRNAASIARIRYEVKTLVELVTISAMVLESLRSGWDGELYPSLSASRATRSRVRAATPSLPESARETVLVESPRLSAKSCKVALRFDRGSSLWWSADRCGAALSLTTREPSS